MRKTIPRSIVQSDYFVFTFTGESVKNDLNTLVPRVDVIINVNFSSNNGILEKMKKLKNEEVNNEEVNKMKKEKI